MGRRTYTAEQIINKLREAEILLSQGSAVGEASRQLGGYRANLLSLEKRVWWQNRCYAASTHAMYPKLLPIYDSVIIKVK
jgi:hypothetical protein